ncbi:MAG: CBS domain-containing protein [Myxococcota bacterium]
MRRNQPITTLMTAGPTAVQVGQPLTEVARLMMGGSFHHVPVLDGPRLVGIVSATDLMRVSFSIDGSAGATVLDPTMALRDVMHAEPRTLQSSQTIRDAVEILAEGRFHSLPVVDGVGNLVGIVTTTDLLRYLRDLY